MKCKILSLNVRGANDAEKRRLSWMSLQVLSGSLAGTLSNLI